MCQYADKPLAIWYFFFCTKWFINVYFWIEIQILENDFKSILST